MGLPAGGADQRPDLPAQVRRPGARPTWPASPNRRASSRRTCACCSTSARCWSRSRPSRSAPRPWRTSAIPCGRSASPRWRGTSMHLPANAAETAAQQWFERTLDDSANRRLVLPEAFLAVDAILILVRDVAGGLEVREAVIRRHVRARAAVHGDRALPHAGGPGGRRPPGAARGGAAAQSRRGPGGRRGRTHPTTSWSDSPPIPPSEASPSPSWPATSRRASSSAGHRSRSTNSCATSWIPCCRGLPEAPPARYAYDDRRARAHLPLPLVRRGKVREVYRVDDERLLLVASDRISAFDFVLDEPVPDKGAVLTQLSAFWFAPARRRGRRTTASPPTPTRSWRRSRRSPAHRALIAGRAMLVPPDRRRCRSSAWCAATSPGRRGRSTGSPARSRASRCRRACASPTRLTGAGLLPRHQGGVGPRRERDVRRAWQRRSGTARGTGRCGERSLAPLRRGAGPRRARGIIIADTKFEFGTAPDGSAAADRRGADPGLVALLAGRPLRARARPSRASTSSRSATTSRACVGPVRGTARRRARRCRTAGRARHHRPVPRSLPPPRGAPTGGPLMRIAPEGWPFIRIGARTRRSLWPGVWWLVAGVDRCCCSSVGRAADVLGRGLLPRSASAPASAATGSSSPPPTAGDLHVAQRRGADVSSPGGDPHFHLHERVQRPREPVPGLRERSRSSTTTRASSLTPASTRRRS